MLTFDLKKISLPPGSKVLDVGCGEGRRLEFAAQHDVHRDCQLELGVVGGHAACVRGAGRVLRRAAVQQGLIVEGE